MQTFLPYPIYSLSAKVLDPSRLGNQVYREGLTIFRALTEGNRWERHPAVRMWRGHERHLCFYCLACLEELAERGLPYPHWTEYFQSAAARSLSFGPPPWLGNAAFHAAHRSNLLRKDPEYYGQFGWEEGPDLPYIWPKP